MLCLLFGTSAGVTTPVGTASEAVAPAIGALRDRFAGTATAAECRCAARRAPSGTALSIGGR